jgi:mannose-6-phosphate isomerase
VKLSPSRLEPVFVPRIWGARSLAPLFPDAPGCGPQPGRGVPIGEVWLTGEESTFACGLYKGRKLGEAWPGMSPEWKGARLRDHQRFPLLVKFLFPEDVLSVQVHPDDDYATRHEAAAGGMGKTEMWYVAAARPGAQVLVGLKPGVTPESFREAIAAATVEDCLERIPVSAGDAIFVPAGTVHTVRPGLLLCEIQENSDLTYRVYDYNRRDAQGQPRPLHVEKALAVIHFGEQSSGRIEPVCIRRGALTETYFVACRYFATEKWEFGERIAAVTSPEHFDLLVFLEGSGKIVWSDAAADYCPGQAWLLPARLGTCHLIPQQRTALLRTYVPDIVNEFVRRLAEQHVEETVWSRLVRP